MFQESISSLSIQRSLGIVISYRFSANSKNLGTAFWEATLKATVFGKRDGVVTGLAITAKDSRNFFHNTKGWKTGTVLNVDMCQRGDMYKPDQATRLF